MTNQTITHEYVCYDYKNKIGCMHYVDDKCSHHCHKKGQKIYLVRQFENKIIKNNNNWKITK